MCLHIYISDYLQQRWETFYETSKLQYTPFNSIAASHATIITDVKTRTVPITVSTDATVSCLVYLLYN